VSKGFTRREWLAGTSLAVAAGVAQAEPTEDKKPPVFRSCLNTATIMGQNLSLTQEIEITAKAGYDAIEPWLSKLEKHAKDGGSLKDIGKRTRDVGLVIPDVIGFFEWIVDDEGRRKKGLEIAKKAMDLVQQVGGQRLAAPPVGATETAGLNLLHAAERYRALLELGDKMGVVPVAEVWGFSKTLGRLGEAALVAIESGHPKACVLADVFHLYKGGSGHGGLKLLSSAALPIIHMNDYPADPPRDKIKDENRIYPGDGIAPLKVMLRDLRTVGFQGYLSLEVFNRGYWKEDALVVARTGLEKMRAIARASQE
jgi:sugar phosphate isomerase/epimerase